MAKPKRPKFENYAEAMARVEELSKEGDNDSADYRIAINAAARLFIAANDNPKSNTQQDYPMRKWKTIKELCEIMFGKQEK
ncbi:MAG: hypothetical protein P4L67_05025 [Candidatus Pacebacteria bacterium]|nr:hypothetical protein [Candidatus Paceibacterota bacterium]